MRGENVGKEQTKTPSWLSRIAFSVTRPCWDLLPVVAHPGPPRAIIDV